MYPRLALISPAEDELHLLILQPAALECLDCRLPQPCCCCCGRDRTQGFRHARPELYPLRHTSSAPGLVCQLTSFSHDKLLKGFPGLQRLFNILVFRPFDESLAILVSKVSGEIWRDSPAVKDAPSSSWVWKFGTYNHIRKVINAYNSSHKDLTLQLTSVANCECICMHACAHV